MFGAADSLGDRAAEVFGGAVDAVLDAGGRCSVALSRPSTGAIFRKLGAAIDRPGVDVFQVDERVAPDGDPERNLALIERLLGDGARVHPMPVGAGDPERAASRYADRLEEACGSPPVLDVVHLGLGPDGHTASLLPGDAVLDVRDRWVAVTGPAGGFRRLTLTYPVLEAARLVVFVVTGRAKAEALARVLGGDRSLPAARLQAGDVRFLVDREAAALSGA